MRCDDGDMQTLHNGSGDTEYMVISHSQMTHFSTQDRNLTNLKDLYISNTNIEQITITSDLVNQKQVTIVYNKRLRHENIVIQAPNLKELNIRNNNLSNIPTLNTRKLEELVISENHVVHFDSKINYFPVVRRLILKNNPLIKFQAAEGLSSLEHLDLENTKVTRFNSSELDIPNLRELILSGNDLESIDLETPLLNLTKLKCDRANLTRMNTSLFIPP